MTRAPQYLKLWLQHKAAHGVYLQVQVTALVTGAAPVHVHLAAGLHPVIDLVIVQAVRANQGVASSQHHTALQLHSQIRTALHLVALHIGRQLFFVRWREVFSQAAAEFELQFGRHLRAQGQHRHRAWGVLQALQLLGALQLRPGLRQSLCRPKTSPWQQASKHRQGGRHAHGERNRWRKRCL